MQFLRKKVEVVKNRLVDSPPEELVGLQHEAQAYNQIIALEANLRSDKVLEEIRKSQDTGEEE